MGPLQDSDHIRAASFGGREDSSNIHPSDPDRTRQPILRMIISHFLLSNRTLRPLLWRCPEWWVLVLSAAAWIFFVVDGFWYRPLEEANSHMWMGHMYHTVPSPAILHALD